MPANNPQTSTKRTRLSPKARRDQILDVAKQYIRRQGLQQFSLKQLAVEASVSEPLLFHYFTSRTELLQQLLKREFTGSLKSLNTSLDNAVTLDDIVRIYVAVNYDQAFEGSVINILLAEPEIAVAIEEIRSENERLGQRMLIDTISGELGCHSKKSGYDRNNGVVCFNLCCKVFPRAWCAQSRRHSNCYRLREGWL
jgi:AcrR family transcriptional regulator